MMTCIHTDGTFNIGDKVKYIEGNDIISRVEYNGERYWVTNKNFRHEK